MPIWNQGRALIVLSAEASRDRTFLKNLTDILSVSEMSEKVNEKSVKKKVIITTDFSGV